MRPEPFTIAVPGSELDDVRERLRRTRWPAAYPQDGWELGSDLATVRRLATRWADGYDWRRHEWTMNELGHYRVEIDGARVHYVRWAAESDGALPVVLTHGWPGSFLEMISLADRLARPSRYGGERSDSFEVIAPSLPGFGFSDPRPGLTNPSTTPELWHRLMTEILGFDRYALHGGDLGAGVSSRLAAAHPDVVVGVHLLAVGGPPLDTIADLSTAERAYLEEVERWAVTEGAYEHQQQTRPLTLAYGLADSPVGLLAWIVEKLRAWTDCDGDLSVVFSDDEIITWVALYWFTGTIASSFRPYNDHWARGTPMPHVGVPTALAVFPADLVHPPREWAERTHALQRYTEMRRGGHFAAREAPDLLAADIIQFFSELR